MGSGVRDEKPHYDSSYLVRFVGKEERKRGSGRVGMEQLNLIQKVLEEDTRRLLRSAPLSRSVVMSFNHSILSLPLSTLHRPRGVLEL